ncbi:MAG: alpha/beta hydrolase [Lachnospiraceae bacterium]|nr:alpha/beta hydrolase [Lachnospiraceae bacterium]
MKHEDFNRKEHGFVGHLAEPDNGSDKAVIVVMGGEQSLLPGIKFAERFADYGITGLSVSLYGAEGLPDSPNQIPVDMFIPAVEYLRDKKKIEHISIYGQSMGSIFAVLAAQYVGGFDNIIMVSPTHVPFEGTLKDKKTMTGRSIATWHEEDIPYVCADFSKVKAGKYQKHPDAKCKVTGMWVAYHDAYEDEKRVLKAKLHVENSNARVLLIAGDEDEAWPAEYSVREIEKDLAQVNYEKDVKVIIYKHGSHLNGLMPNREREKKLYRMIPMIGLMYKTFGKYRKENLSYFESSEKEIIDWITTG